MRTKKSLIGVELWLIISIGKYTQIDWKLKTINERIEYIKDCIKNNTIKYSEIKYWTTEKYSKWFKRLVANKYSYLNKIGKITELDNNIIVLVEEYENDSFWILVYHIK